MTQAILISKIKFMDIAMKEYVHIRVNEDKVTVDVVERDQAKQIVKENDLKKAQPSDYIGEYNHKYGEVYADSKFQKTLNKSIRAKQKQFLLNIIDNV